MKGSPADVIFSPSRDFLPPYLLMLCIHVFDSMLSLLKSEVHSPLRNKHNDYIMIPAVRRGRNHS